MISILRQAKNDYYEPSESVLQIGHLLAVMRFSGNFTLTSPKGRSDDKR